MKFCLYTVSISPHQLPLARELVKLLGVTAYRYVYRRRLNAERQAMGWEADEPDWLLQADSDEAREWLLSADVLVSGERDVMLFKARSAAGKKTIYSAERWFKPITIGFGRWCVLNGRFRLLSPRYRKMALEMMELVRRDENFMLYPIGIHAARDFAWLLGCKIVDFERKPGGRVFGKGKWLEKIRIWGYFVEPSSVSDRSSVHVTRRRPFGFSISCRIIWVGRFLAWKHVEDLILAVTKIGCYLDIFGVGPEMKRLEKLIGTNRKIALNGVIPINEVREKMRNHDLYVLCSDENEGWGATINEAIEEGLSVIGTYEAGGSATILGEGALYHAGDVQGLVKRIATGGMTVGNRLWSAKNAALVLLNAVCGAGAMASSKKQSDENYPSGTFN